MVDQLIKTEKIVKAKKSPKRDYMYAVGRRKEAIARVRLYTHVKEGAKWGEVALQKEQILVNGKPVEHYFPGPIAKAIYMRPLTLTNTFGKFAITAKISGGGQSSQLGAFVAGIARVLSANDPAKYRKTLKAKGLLTRDPRVRERRKVGTGGKARRKKQSPKR